MRFDRESDRVRDAEILSLIDRADVRLAQVRAPNHLMNFVRDWFYRCCYSGEKSMNVSIGA